MSVISSYPIGYADLEKALVDINHIRTAFSWEHSYQGHHFWEEVAEGTAPPDEKEIALKLIRTELLLHKGVALEVTQEQLEELL